MAERLPDWEPRLNALIDERRDWPFEWGLHDCALWATAGHLAVTGVDLGASYRGRYRTAIGALRALRQVDAVGLPVDLADKLLGERLPSASALVGSVVAADLDALGLSDPAAGPGMGLALGVCYGRNSLFVGSEGPRNGLIVVPTLSLEHCYRG